MRNPSLMEALEGRTLMSSTTVLIDNFSGDEVNAARWHIPTWQGPTDGTYFGRTQIAVSQNESPPDIVNGAVRLTLNTFNPTGFSFYGTELRSNQLFRIRTGKGMEFEVRARLNAAIPGGVVGGLFLYYVKPNGLHDEVDFELLSNEVVSHANKVSTNVYAEEPLGAGSPVFSPLPKGKLTQFHTYKVRVYPGNRVSFYVDGKVVRTDRTTVPAGPFEVRLNLWAPDAGWSTAYDAGIQPTADASANRRFSMDVDRVRVSMLSAKVTRPASPPAIQITSVPPLGGDGVARGRVTGTRTDVAGVAAYIKVAGGWWTKPAWDAPLTPIAADGAWNTDIVTGGQDADATEIRAYLVPRKFTVPLASGESTLSASLAPLRYATVVR